MDDPFIGQFSPGGCPIPLPIGNQRGAARKSAGSREEQDWEGIHYWALANGVIDVRT